MDVTYLQRAALAGAFVLPLVAGAAVVTQGDSSEPVCCAGCGKAFPRRDLAPGDAGTQWCKRCIAEGELPFDCVAEDDGEP